MSKVESYTTPEDQSLGLRRFAGRAIPPDTVFFFPYIQGGVLTTEGMTESIIAVFLDGDFGVLGAYLMPTKWKMPAPPGSRHLIEFSLLHPWSHASLPQLKGLALSLRGHAGG